MSGVGRLDLIHQFSHAENKKKSKSETPKQALERHTRSCMERGGFSSQFDTTRERTMLLGVRALI